MQKHTQLPAAPIAASGILLEIPTALNLPSKVLLGRVLYESSTSTYQLTSPGGLRP
jgi:hypothetical protein